MQFEKKRNWQKKMYSRETNNFHVLSDDRLVHSPSALIIFIQMNHTYNIDINNNYNEVEDDPMHLLVQDGNGSIVLTSSQKRTLFDRLFQCSVSPDQQQEIAKIQTETIQYVFERPQKDKKPEIESKSCLEPEEEAAEVPR